MAEKAQSPDAFRGWKPWVSPAHGAYLAAFFDSMKSNAGSRISDDDDVHVEPQSVQHDPFVPLRDRDSLLVTSRLWKGVLA